MEGEAHLQQILKGNSSRSLGFASFGFTFAPLIMKDGGIGPCDVLATGDPHKVLLSTTPGVER